MQMVNLYKNLLNVFTLKVKYAPGHLRQGRALCVSNNSGLYVQMVDTSEQERKPINFRNFKSEVIVVHRGFILKRTDGRTWIHCSGSSPPPIS
jgi:hypothetical protein